ncbi:hypothetical protein CRYUN_Cryun14cG0005400 [Craigia yunnanensis]
MSRMPNTNSTSQNITTNQRCLNFVTVTMMSGSEKFITIISAYVLSRVAHRLLKPLSQPFITSDLLIGLILASLPPVRDSFVNQLTLTLDNVVDFGMIFYTFVLGFGSRNGPLRDLEVTNSPCNGGLCWNALHIHHSMRCKSDIGKLGIVAGVHSDMITMFLLSIGFIFFPMENIASAQEGIKDIIKMVSALVIQTTVAPKISPIFIDWVNNENPEGKPLQGSHLVLSMAFMAVICSCAPWFGYNSFLSAFMAGLFLPSEGRISKWAISKINYLLSILFYPLLFFWVGLKVDLSSFQAGSMETWGRFFSLLLITTVGKVAGTVICGLLLGYHWPELVPIGLLLTAKGHFHAYLAIHALRNGRIHMTTCISMLIVIFLTIVHTPFVVKHIIERARKRVPIHRMALQCTDPSSELIILLCVHGPHSLPSTINLLEISRGKPDPGLRVYVTDMIELTEQIAATLVQGEGVDNMTTTDKSVTEMRDQISHAFQAYIDKNGDGITISRMLALSTFSGMAQDLSGLADA